MTVAADGWFLELSRLTIPRPRICCGSVAESSHSIHVTAIPPTDRRRQTEIREHEHAARYFFHCLFVDEFSVAGAGPAAAEAELAL